MNQEVVSKPRSLISALKEALIETGKGTKTSSDFAAVSGSALLYSPAIIAG